MTTQFSCPICCEDLPSSAKCVLTNCSHECCNMCMKRLIDQAASNLPSTCPTCPFCRTNVARRDIRAIKSSSSPPRRITSSATTTTQQRRRRPRTTTTTTATMDDLTMQWIQTNTRPCPNCGTRIERPSDDDHDEGSNDTMECLCGCYFDWNATASATPIAPVLEPPTIRPTHTQVSISSSPTTTNAAVTATATEMDEYTLHWLQENTKPCPRCTARIERTDDNNDMWCLACGCLFCYGCGSDSNGLCTCFEALWNRFDVEIKIGPGIQVLEEQQRNTRRRRRERNTTRRRRPRTNSTTRTTRRRRQQQQQPQRSPRTSTNTRRQLLGGPYHGIR